MVHDTRPQFPPRPDRVGRTTWSRLAALAIVIGLALLPFARAAQAAGALPDGVTEQSFTLPGGERVLQLATVIDAPVAKVWAAFTTEPGFTAWAVPLARIDLRVGGSIETSYDPKVPLGSNQTIRNEIVALVPERLLVMRNVQAPPGVPFDVAIFQSTQTALWFEPLDAARTRLTLVAGRFLAGPAYDGVMKFFQAGNAYTFGELRKHLAAAPAGAGAGAGAGADAPAAKSPESAATAPRTPH